MAGNYWGIPRGTPNLDFVIQLPPSAVPAIVQASSGGFPSPGLKATLSSFRRGEGRGEGHS